MNLKFQPVALFLFSAIALSGLSVSAQVAGGGGGGGGGGAAAPAFHGHYFRKIEVMEFETDAMIDSVLTQAGNKETNDWIANCFHHDSYGGSSSPLEGNDENGNEYSFPQTVAPNGEFFAEVSDIDLGVIPNELWATYYEDTVVPAFAVPDIIDIKFGSQARVDLPQPYNMSQIFDTPAQGHPVETFQLRFRLDAPNNISRDEFDQGDEIRLVVRVLDNVADEWLPVFCSFEFNENSLTLDTDTFSLSKSFAMMDLYRIEAYFEIREAGVWVQVGEKLDFYLEAGTGR